MSKIHDFPEKVFENDEKSLFLCDGSFSQRPPPRPGVSPRAPPQAAEEAPPPEDERQRDRQRALQELREREARALARLKKLPRTLRAKPLPTRARAGTHTHTHPRFVQLHNAKVSGLRYCPAFRFVTIVIISFGAIHEWCVNDTKIESVHLF